MSQDLTRMKWFTAKLLVFFSSLQLHTFQEFLRCPTALTSNIILFKVRPYQRMMCGSNSLILYAQKPPASLFYMKSFPLMLSCFLSILRKWAIFSWANNPNFLTPLVILLYKSAIFDSEIFLLFCILKAFSHYLAFQKYSQLLSQLRYILVSKVDFLLVTWYI